MKRLIIAALLSTLSLSAGEFEKEGFLTTAKCAEAGMFVDCYLENYACGSEDCNKETKAWVDNSTPLVLFSHDDGVVYNVDSTHLNRGELLENVSRNKVVMKGEYDASTNTIIATEFKAPPPPTKSFFKGCL